MKKQMMKILKERKIKKLIAQGYEYFTITENGKVTAIHFYKGV